MNSIIHVQINIPMWSPSGFRVQNININFTVIEKLMITEMIKTPEIAWRKGSK